MRHTPVRRMVGHRFKELTPLEKVKKKKYLMIRDDRLLQDTRGESML